MVGCFNDVVDADSLIGDANGIRFKDIARLVVCQAAAFDVIGVVRQIDLNFMIDTSRKPAFLFSFQVFEQRFGGFFCSGNTSGLFCVFWNIPCLTCQKGIRNTTMSTVVTNGSLRNIPFFAISATEQYFIGSASMHILYSVIGKLSMKLLRDFGIIIADTGR